MFGPKDRTILRDLAKHVAEIAALPAMEERRNDWIRHNRLERVRPMILVFPEGSWGELLPADILQCEDQEARTFEWELRHRIYTFEHFDSDNTVEDEWMVARAISNTGWGMEPRHIPSTTSRGAWAFDPVINDASDLKKLHFPDVSCDDKITEERYEQADNLFGDILTLKIRGVSHVSFHLMNHYTSLRGLEQVMVDMCENPSMLHEALSFLEEGNKRLIDQYVELNLLSANNDQMYHSSGGYGYSTELPLPDCDPARIRPCDMWASAETQEFAQVSPAMHREFALAYEKRLLAPFGLNGYGCCEDLTNKMVDVLTIPNIRRISIAPMANVDKCAERLGDQAIYSWKPDPSFLIGDFDEERLKAYLEHAVNATQNCVFEMILKDTHTCESRTERFDSWTRIARQVVNETA